MPNAADIRKKISSIRTDFEMAEDGAVVTGLYELEEMFSQFCDEAEVILSRIKETVGEMDLSLANAVNTLEALKNG